MPEERIPSWAERQIDLNREVYDTLHDGVIRRQKDRSWQGGHDEGSFVASWFGYYLLSGYTEAKDFLYSFREDFLSWLHRTQYHGYWCEGEAHHHVEIFNEWFVYYWLLDKNDSRCIEAVEDAAEHIGNWVPSIPEWYNWQTHMFRSWYLGTKVVRAEPPFDYNSFDNLELIDLALYAFQMTGKSRYLELCEDYLDAWNEILLGTDGPPQLVRFPMSDPDAIAQTYWAQEHRGVSASIKASYLYPNRIGDDWKSYRDDYETVFLGYTTPIYSSLVRFTNLSGTKKYYETIKKMIDGRNSFVGKRAAYGGYTVPLNYRQMKGYRDLTGNPCYDKEISEYEAQCVKDWEEISHLPNILLLNHFSLNVPWDAWMKWAYRDENGRLAECVENLGSPFAAYRKTHNRDILANAMEQARVRLRMAGFSLRDGREHGCAGRHFIHGPLGAASRLLSELTTGWHGFDMQDPTSVLYYRSDGRLGLPKDVAALLESEEGGVNIALYNVRREEIEMIIQAKNVDNAVLKIQADVPAKEEVLGWRLALPPGREVTVRIQVVA